MTRIQRSYLLLVPLFLGVLLLVTWRCKFYPFRENPFLALPVQFSSSNLPYTEIELEGRKYLATIDLGGTIECALKPELLEKVSKQYYDSSKWIDIRGNIYEAKEYIVPLVKIKSAEIRKLKIKAEDPKFKNEGSLLWGDPETSSRENGRPIDGRLGWIFLQSLHPFFDFKNSVFYFTRGYKSLRYLKEEGYPIDKLQSFPFEMTRFGCVFRIDTEYGLKKFLADTGSSRIIIKPSRFQNLEESKITTISTEKQTILFEKFMIGTQDFKDTKAYFFEFSDQFENIDGILGMDFFQENIVFLDFDEHKAWVGPSVKF